MIIAHATDLTGDDTAAFVHAVALATASGARLVTLHGNPGGASPDQLPDARELARTWGVEVEHDRRCHECCDDVGDTIVDALRDLRPALVVFGTHARHGLSALFRASVSASVIRNLDVPALVVPNRGRSFVDVTTGAIDLSRIAIPAGSLAEATHGVTGARELVRIARAGAASLELLHAGTPNPELSRLGLPVTNVDGSLEQAIVLAARDASVIVMPTHGHDSTGDVVAGSHTERVIRDATCPVLVLPS